MVAAYDRPALRAVAFCLVAAMIGCRRAPLPSELWRRADCPKAVWTWVGDNDPIPGVVACDDLEVAGIGRVTRDFVVSEAAPGGRTASIDVFYRETDDRIIDGVTWTRCVRIAAEDYRLLDPAPK